MQEMVRPRMSFSKGDVFGYYVLTLFTLNTLYTLYYVLDLHVGDFKSSA